MSVLEDLQAAREIVAERWCPRGLTDAEGNVCLVGALNIVTCGRLHPNCAISETKDYYTRRDRACDELGKYLPDGFVLGGLDLAMFNDAPSTTHQDVLDLFDKAIANC